MKRLVLVIAFTLLIAGNAFAFPVADGINSLGEWTTGLVINAFDPNEAGIPDDYDIKRVAMQGVFLGGATDGGYAMIELFGTPSFLSLDELAPINPVIYTTAMDLNLDGDFSDAIDRILEFKSTGFTVYDGTGGIVGGSPTAVMGSVVEYFIPAAMFSAFPTGPFNTFSSLDNGGEPTDDRLPDAGFNMSTPEPASAALLGFGLIGLVGGMFRRKFSA